jgi:phage shock protein PspC (stress-responsive transcriptional regulator)
MSENPTQQPMQAPPPPAPPAPNRLLRSRNDRWIAGVCGGIGEYAGVDPNLVRLLAVVGAVFSAGTLFLAYIVAWIVMPEG